MMGGLQRWVNRDFPEFYDQFPDFANVMDQLGRVGFYPNIYISLFQALPIANRAGISQLGEVVPAPIGTALEAMIAIDPDNVFSNALSDIILPNRFKDYRIALRMAENLPAGEGNPRAAEILFKRLRGEELTTEEQGLWNSAERRSSLDSIFDYQVGLFRLRPEELVAARKLSKEIILSYIPITSEQYDEAHKKGMPIEDYYPYPPELNEALREVEAIARWRGLATHMGESAVAQMLLAQQDYWKQVSDRRDEIMTEEAQLDRRFRMLGVGADGLGHINQSEWRRLKTDLNVKLQNFIEEKKAEFEERGVPIEYDDRLAFAREHETLAPIQHPLEEMVGQYFSKSPEDFQFYDQEIGAMTTDWDGFYKWRAVLEDSLEGVNRERFMSRIHRWDTDLDRSRREDYETFIRPHKAIWGLTLEEFTRDEQSIIRQFYATDSSSVREELRETESRGSKIVARFQSTLSDRRKRLRLLDPEIDARLAFWGESSSVASEQAKQIHDSLYTKYGIQEREVVPIELPDPLTFDTQI